MAGFDFNDAGKQGSGGSNSPRPTPLPEIIERFRDAIAAKGFGRPEIKLSGHIERFALPEDNGGETSGWYIFHTDGIPAGAFGSWREGEDAFCSWCSKARFEMTLAEQAEYKRWLDSIRARKKEDEERASQAARLRAEKLWANAKEEGESEYAKRKQVDCLNVRFMNGTLLIPIYNFNLDIVSVQLINPKGRKRFLKGSKRKETIGLIDPANDMDTVFVCEGWATGVSIRMATGCAVVLGFNAGGLDDAVRFAKEKCPASKIIIAGDNDANSKKADGTPFNAGLEKAHKAAEKYNIRYVLPQFKNPGPKDTDFNDLAIAEGLERVREMLTPKAYGIFTLNEVVNIHIPSKPIAEGLFDEGESLLIVGPSNVGKSLFLFNLVLALCSPLQHEGSKDFNERPLLFGKFPIAKQQKALILQSENSTQSIQARLQKMTDKNAMLKEALNHITIPLLGDNDCRIHGNINGDFRGDATNLIVKSKANLVCLDTLVSFHDSDENDNVKMRHELDGLSDLAKELHITPIVIHHTGKAGGKGGARGASAIRDWADNMVLLEPCHEDDDKFIIKVIHDKSRNHKIIGSFFLERTTNLLYNLLEDPGKEMLVRVLAENGGSIQGEKALLDAYNQRAGEEITRYSLIRRIKKAVKDELITKDGKGRDTYYALTDKAKNMAPSVRPDKQDKYRE